MCDCHVTGEVDQTAETRLKRRGGPRREQIPPAGLGIPTDDLTVIITRVCSFLKRSHLSSLDRLLLLLDTGSSQSVRHTAAKQLAQLAVKSVTSNVQIVEEDTKREQTNLRDQASWAELMSVVARVCPSRFAY